jgi:hypothetical protein
MKKLSLKHQKLRFIIFKRRWNVGPYIEAELIG